MKTNIRYIGFRTIDGNRFFDFAISGLDVAAPVMSLEIPAHFFAGGDHIKLQEGVGICYAKLKHLVEAGLPDMSTSLCLTTLDMEQYRETRLTGSKHAAPSSWAGSRMH